MDNRWDREEYLKILLSNPPDQLINMIVHDLRNRTTGIVASAQLLSDETITDLTTQQKTQILRTIEQSAIDILNVLEALSNYHSIQQKTLDDDS